MRRDAYTQRLRGCWAGRFEFSFSSRCVSGGEVVRWRRGGRYEGTGWSAMRGGMLMTRYVGGFLHAYVVVESANLNKIKLLQKEGKLNANYNLLQYMRKGH